MAKSVSSFLSDTKSYLWIALLAALLMALIVQFPVLVNEYAVEEDFRTLFWMHRFQDPELFQRVPFDKLGIREAAIGPEGLMIENSSPGYSLLFYAASFVTTPAEFSKLLVFPLLLTAVFFIFRIGEKLANRRTALILALVYTVLILASHTEISVIAGLHRSFVTPLLLGLLYFLLTSRYAAAAIILFLSGVVYLPIFPVCAMTYFFAVVRLRQNGRWRLQVEWRAIVYLAVAFLLVVAAVAPVLLDRLNVAAADTAEVVEPQPHILQDPEFQPGGRRPLFRVFPFVGRGGLVSGNSDSLHILFLTVFALIIWLMRRRQTKMLPPPFPGLLLAAFIGYGLAWASIIFLSSFLFYVPSRHTQSALFLLLLIFVLLNAEAALKSVLTWIMARRRQLVWYLLPLVLAALGLALFLPMPVTGSKTVMRGPIARVLLAGLTLTLFGLAVLYTRRSPQVIIAPQRPATGTRWALFILPLILSPLYIFFMQSFHGSFTVPAETERELLTFLGELPVESVIGGDPCALDNVQFYAKRTVLFSCERYQFLNSPETIRAMLGAYYAADGTDVVDFCTEYGVDYLVVNEDTLTAEFVAAGDFFFEPYNGWLQDQLRGQREFALAAVPDGAKLFQVDNRFVVPCSPSLFSQ